jgi:hypothetical protein
MLAHSLNLLRIQWLTGSPSSPYLEPAIQEFSGAGYNVQVLSGEYEFQRGGDRMLKISKQLLKNH